MAYEGLCKLQEGQYDPITNIQMYNQQLQGDLSGLLPSLLHTGHAEMVYGLGHQD